MTKYLSRAEVEKAFTEKFDDVYLAEIATEDITVFIHAQRLADIMAIEEVVESEKQYQYGEIEAPSNSSEEKDIAEKKYELLSDILAALAELRSKI